MRMQDRYMTPALMEQFYKDNGITREQYEELEREAEQIRKELDRKVTERPGNEADVRSNTR